MLSAVLPDFERWGENYVLIDFDGDPTADHPRLQKLPGHKRRQLAGLLVLQWSQEGIHEHQSFP